MTNNDALSFLPDPGAGRLWRVSHNAKSRTQPMVLQLIERYARGRKGPTSIIGFEYATANEKDLANKAEEVLERVKDYDKFVGDYDREAVES